MVCFLWWYKYGLLYIYIYMCYSINHIIIWQVTVINHVIVNGWIKCLSPTQGVFHHSFTWQKGENTEKPTKKYLTKKRGKNLIDKHPYEPPVYDWIKHISQCHPIYIHTYPGEPWKIIINFALGNFSPAASSSFFCSTSKNFTFKLTWFLLLASRHRGRIFFFLKKVFFSLSLQKKLSKKNFW